MSVRALTLRPDPSCPCVSLAARKAPSLQGLAQHRLTNTLARPVLQAHRTHTSASGSLRAMPRHCKVTHHARALKLPLWTASHQTSRPAPTRMVCSIAKGRLRGERRQHRRLREGMRLRLHHAHVPCSYILCIGRQLRCASLHHLGH